jgi:hypothetical protein
MIDSNTGSPNSMKLAYEEEIGLKHNSQYAPGAY